MVVGGGRPMNLKRSREVMVGKPCVRTSLLHSYIVRWRRERKMDMEDRV